LASISILFACAAWRNITRPFPLWEEAIVGQPAIALLGGGSPDEVYTTVRVRGVDLPIFRAVYGVGTISTYMLLPVYKIFGISVRSLRAAEILMTMLTGMIFAVACLLLLDARTFYAFTPMLFFHAHFFIFGKQGLGSGVLLQWLSLGCVLLSLALWLRAASPYYLYAAAFFVGVGMYAKLQFAGIALALCAGALLLRRRSPRPRELDAALAKSSLFLLLGLSPFIIWNLFNRGASFSTLGNLFANPLDSVSNWHYLNGMAIRCRQLLSCCSGLAEALHGVGMYWAFLPSFIGAASLGPVLLLFSASLRGQLAAPAMKAGVPIALIALTIAVYIACVSFRGTKLGEEHVFVLLPLVILLIAASAAAQIRNGYLLALFVLAYMVPNVLIIRLFHRQTSLLSGQEQGYEELSRDLIARRSYAPVIVNDIEISPKLELVSGGRIAPIPARRHRKDLFDGRFPDQARRWLANPEQLFIITSEKSVNLGLFMQEAAKMGKKPVLLRRFFGDNSYFGKTVDLYKMAGA